MAIDRQAAYFTVIVEERSHSQQSTNNTATDVRTQHKQPLIVLTYYPVITVTDLLLLLYSHSRPLMLLPR